MKYKAFTLIDSLMALCVMSILIVILNQMVIVLLNYDDYYQNKELIQFVINSSNDFKESKQIDIKDKNLEFMTYNDNVVTYEYKDNKIYRKVNNKGGEIMLYDIEDIKYIDKNKKIEYQIKFTNQKESSGILGYENE